MSGTHLRAPHRTTGAVWRAWLARRAGWRALRGLPEPLTVDGRELSLLPLACAGEVVALLCEPVLGGALPDYAARRRIRGAIEAAHLRPLTLFVDGANLERVWSWVQEEAGGVVAYREAEGSGAEAESPVAAPDLAAAAAARGRCSAVPELDTGAGVVLHRLARALGLPVEPAADLPQRIQHAVEGSSAPGPLRAAWPALLRTRVLDPACGTGDRLLAAARLLEPPYLACLERMRAWVCETGRERPALRRDRLADFRRLVGRAGPPGDRRRWVRELILYHNLSGADPDPAVVATCRRRLLDHLRAGSPAGEPAPEGASFNVRAGDLARGIATRRELERLSAADPAQAASLLEEVETAIRVRRVILRLHLEGAVDAEALEAGARSVHRWLDRVAPALDHLLPAGSPGAAPALHGVLEHAGAETLTVLAGPRA